MLNPDLSLEACTEPLTDSKITLKRDGRRATFRNPDRTTIKLVDLDCWIRTAATAKADFIVSKPAVVDVIVELKGKDIAHAVEQITTTLLKWKQGFQLSEKVGGLIVFTRCPIRAAELGDIKKRLLVQHGLWIEIDKDQKSEYRFEQFTGRKA